MRILVVDRFPPLDLRQGNALIGRHIFPRLARQHELTLLCPAPPDDAERVRAEAAAWFCDVQLVARDTRPTALKGSLEPVVGRRVPTRMRRGVLRWTQEFDSRLRVALASGQFDVIHTRELPMSGYVGPHHHPAKLLELVDSAALRERRRLDLAAPATWPRYPLARALESRAVRNFQVVTTVAEADAATIRSIDRSANIQVIANGVDTDYFSPSNAAEAAGSVLFVGAMSFPPNVDAVCTFHRFVWPRILQRFPTCRFIICGRDPAPGVLKLAADPSVVVTGEVDDVRPWLARASIVVCPMASGTGIKNKVLEALAMSKAVVATPLGVEALHVVDGRELRVADSPESFAERCIDLLTDADARTRLGASGRCYVLGHHTWDACARKYDDLYHELAAMTAEFAAAVPLNAGNAPTTLPRIASLKPRVPLDLRER